MCLRGPRWAYKTHSSGHKNFKNMHHEDLTMKHSRFAYGADLWRIFHFLRKENISEINLKRLHFCGAWTMPILFLSWVLSKQKCKKYFEGNLILLARQQRKELKCFIYKAFIIKQPSLTLRWWLRIFSLIIVSLFEDALQKFTRARLFTILLLFLQTLVSATNWWFWVKKPHDVFNFRMHESEFKFY